MAIMTPPTVAVTPQAQTCIRETGLRSTMLSQEDFNSELLDGFFKSCTGMAPTHPVPVSSALSYVCKSKIVTLPLNIIQKILRNLLTSPHPLILEHGCISRPQGYRTYVEPKVLQVCKDFHNIGIAVLYGENTLTTSSPATSFDFDRHLLSLPGRKRQLITDIRLEIDWADQLWAKFPLVARALGELRGLAKLEMVIVEEENLVVERKRRTVSIGKDADLRITIVCDQASSSSSGKVNTARQRAPAIDRADNRMKREGPVADAMLEAEMNMLKDLVTGLKGLKRFRLIGFRHEVFAWCLEEQVRIGNR